MHSGHDCFVWVDEIMTALCAYVVCNEMFIVIAFDDHHMVKRTFAGIKWIT